MADGHKTETPSYVTYINDVSRYLVRTCLTIAALNDIDLIAADIENACLLAPFQEMFWMRSGPKFGNLEGKLLVVKMVLYGLKSTVAVFRAFLVEILDDVGFRSSITNPNIWMREDTKPTGEMYYEYTLCCVYDILCISHDASQTMGEIENNVKFKKNNIDEPDFYLGASLKKS